MYACGQTCVLSKTSIALTSHSLYYVQYSFILLWLRNESNKFKIKQYWCRFKRALVQLNGANIVLSINKKSMEIEVTKYYSAYVCTLTFVFVSAFKIVYLLDWVTKNSRIGIKPIINSYISELENFFPLYIIYIYIGMYKLF